VVQTALHDERRLTAAEAKHYGLVNAVMPKEKLLDTAREWADTIASGPPPTIQAVKEALRAIDGPSVRESFNIVHSGKLPVYERAVKSEDAKEGARAFAEKRKANFKGR
jgi:crotonobetainyl-CoA hydratase